MADSASAPAPAPPSLRTLARLAGVTSMTVSLALRNHPSISTATKARLKKLATEHGYRPDPVVSQLMQHLRTRRSQRRQCLLCGLRLRPRPVTSQGYDFGQLVLEGARQRAESLGFAFEEMWIDEPATSPRRLDRVLASRGVEGVVLLPMIRPVKLTRLLNWSAYAAVAATSSVLAPRLHTVIPDQFGNMMKLCRALTAQGARRIGLVTLDEQDLRVEHRVAAALGWHNTIDGGSVIPPLITRRDALNASVLQDWVESYQLQAIVGDSEFDLDLLAAALPLARRRRLLFATTSIHPPLARYPGIAEKPEDVGVAAIESLAAMIQRGERGVPESPRTLLIPGRYFGPTIQPTASAGFPRRTGGRARAQT